MPFLGTTGGGSVKQYGGLANLGYFIKNSLRFRASNSNYLNRTFGTPTNNKVWTWSAWVKRGSLTLADADHLFFGSPTDVGGNPSSYTRLVFETDDTLRLQSASSASEAFTSSAVFRDPAAWYHIVLYMDAVNTTVRCYVNGTEIAYASRSNPTNTNTAINGSGNHHRMGFFRTAEPRPMDGYMAEVNFIDGQALTPSSFGKTDGATGQWIPKKFAGTYGTNGFYLKFADASAATAAAIGKDSSGNGNNWTPNNISVTAGVTYDAMIDSPTLSAAASNFATWNPLNAFQSTLSQGNLYSSATGSSTDVVTTFPTATTGKWYSEITMDFSVNINWPIVFGISSGVGGNTYCRLYTDWSSFYLFFSVNGTTSNQILSSTLPANLDILKIAYDADTGNMWLGLNSGWYSNSGALTGDPSTGSNPTKVGVAGLPMYPNHSNAGGPAQSAFLNCGQRPFTYTPPSGFKSLNTYNLP